MTWRCVAILLISSWIGIVPLVAADDICNAAVPTPPPGLKLAGMKAFEIGPGHANGSTDPACPPAYCLALGAGLPAQGVIQEVHLCAGEMVKPIVWHECTKVNATPVWWDCHDNPPFARFFPDVHTEPHPTIPSLKLAKVTFKTWSDNYRTVKFIIYYKGGRLAANESLRGSYTCQGTPPSAKTYCTDLDTVDEKEQGKNR